MLPCTKQACNSLGWSANFFLAFPSVYIHINLFFIHTFALLFFSFLTCSLMHSWSRDPMTAVFILKHTWRISHTQYKYNYSLWNTPGELATHSTATHSKGLKSTSTIIPGTWTISPYTVTFPWTAIVTDLSVHDNWPLCFSLLVAGAWLPFTTSVTFSWNSTIKKMDNINNVTVNSFRPRPPALFLLHDPRPPGSHTFHTSVPAYANTNGTITRLVACTTSGNVLCSMFSGSWETLWIFKVVRCTKINKSHTDSNGIRASSFNIWTADFAQLLTLGTLTNSQTIIFGDSNCAP